MPYKNNLDKIVWSKQYYKKTKEKQLVYNREYDKTHKDKKALRSKRYLNRHREERIAYGKQYREIHREEIKWKQIHRNHHLGLTWQETKQAWMNQFMLQNGLCLICKDSPATDIDHNHITGKIRGLLCSQCNIGLGHFKVDEKSIELLLAAISYLKNV